VSGIAGLQILRAELLISTAAAQLLRSGEAISCPEILRDLRFAPTSPACPADFKDGRAIRSPNQAGLNNSPHSELVDHSHSDLLTNENLLLAIISKGSRIFVYWGKTKISRRWAN